MSDEAVNSSSNSAVTEAVTFEIPPECCVVFYNDDYTTKDFVVQILIEIFHKNETEAVELMELVHKSGRAVVGVYTYDIAVTRASIATTRARKSGFPLKVEVEKE